MDSSSGWSLLVNVLLSPLVEPTCLIGLLLQTMATGQGVILNHDVDNFAKCILRDARCIRNKRPELYVLLTNKPADVCATETG